jgi:hypothetical protein
LSTVYSNPALAGALFHRLRSIYVETIENVKFKKWWDRKIYCNL